MNTILHIPFQLFPRGVTYFQIVISPNIRLSKGFSVSALVLSIWELKLIRYKDGFS